MSYPIAVIGISMRTRPRRSNALRHPDDREAARGREEPEGAPALAGKTGIDEKQLPAWANIADRMRIKGMGKDYAGLLLRRSASIP